MITKDNFRNLLKILKFEEKGNVFSKHFKEIDAYLKVDFNKEELFYPEDKKFIVNERQTCNFSSNENFVVFECVHNLFSKGYKPEHIELEPKWKVGHGASGGRADILVKDNSENSLLIIECKTDGREFNEEWKGMLDSGGQLFTYARQAGSTQFICLYSSDFADGKSSFKNHIIALIDNKKLLEEKKAAKPLSYSKAKDYKELFKAWSETYDKDYSTKGIFEADIQAYQIGKLKYTVDDLIDVGSKDIQGKYHEFATILRQHNVSGRENAFDKLVNLFLCKIVDETKNPKDLKFFWKGIAYDTYFDLQDRLQQLYQIGMKLFLREDVTYIDNEKIETAFRFFKKDPDATKETIKDYFRKLKFFTNNDFAFVDVHNEKLFYQNSAVLLKMVQMLQDNRLQTETQNQFLGDLFEGFLDQGVKQSEGQFFTPMPVVKFILNSLPLESIVKENELPPRAIDYACGAGHFLNELATQLKPFVDAHKKTDIKEYYKQILGVEKEYRLSKVAKVSAFMYGQDEINIIYADALAKHSQVHEGEYSILVANPPYAVKGFLQTLSETDRNKFSLMDSIEEKSILSNNSIETFFIERAKQLLKPNGVAGIIMPASILSNTASVYVSARETLLKYFEIIGIAEFGSRTFGKTGTSTVTLFLKRREENPSSAEHFKNRVESWFNNDEKDAVFADSHFIKKYCEHIEIDVKQYETLLRGTPTKELLANEMFKDYQSLFDNSTEIKNLKKQKSFSKKTKKEQEEELEKRLVAFLQEIEKDKLYYFVLAASSKQDVVIVRSPSDNKEQKQFLGYEWSSAKGNEGIKYVGVEYAPTKKEEGSEGNGDDEESRILSNITNLSRIKTPLYDPTDRSNSEKLNFLIQQNFIGKNIVIPATLIPFARTARLIDMLDFKRKEFAKGISLTPKQNLTILSKYDSVKLNDFIDTIESGSRPTGGVDNYSSGALSLGGEHIHNSNGTINLTNTKFVPLAFFNSAKRGIIKKNDILLCKDGALTGKIGFVRNELDGKQAMVNEHLFILRCNDLTNQKYLFNILFSSEGQNILRGNITGAAQGGLNLTNLSDIKIPSPPKDIQTKIVSECEKIDKDYLESQQLIEKSRADIVQKVQRIINDTSKSDKIENLCSVNSGGTPSRNNYAYWNNGTIPWLRSEVCKEGDVYTANENITEEGLKNSNAKYFEKGTTLIALVGATKGKTAFLQFKATTNQNIAGVYSNDEKVILNRYLFYVLRGMYQILIKDLSQYDMLDLGQIKNIRVPVPDMKAQKKLVEEIETVEKKIKTAQTTLDNASEKKKEIMKKYLVP